MTVHQLHWKSLVIPVVLGVLIVVGVWWAGPSALGAADAPKGTTAEATVITAAPCTDANPRETVQFSFGGQTRTGSLDACGHDPNDRVQITVPTGIGTAPVDVHLADVVTGHGTLRGPVGLVLLTLSCFAGAAYAFLMARRTRPTAVVTA